MTPDEMVARIRDGGGQAVVMAFMQANPGVTFETMIGSALQWGLDDISETIFVAAVRAQADHFEANNQLARLLARQGRYAESAPYFEFLGQQMPTNSFVQSGRCWAHFSAGDIDALCQAVASAQAHLKDGEHLDWQCGINPSSAQFPDLLQKLKAHEHSERLAVRKRMVENPLGPKSHSSSDNPVPSSLASAETHEASEIGQTGAIFQGRVSAAAAKAEYRFEYGENPSCLGQATAWAPVPGNRNARLVATPHRTPGAFKIYAGRQEFEQGAAPAIVCKSPFGKDPNHISGIGFIDLFMGFWHNTCQPDGYQDILLSEMSDLRGAILELTLEVEDFDAKGFLYVPGIGNGNSYWMLTDCAVDLEAKSNTGPFKCSFVLDCTPTRWTTAGNNTEEQGGHRDYQYGPLDQCLSPNGGNVVFLGAFGDWRDTPTGRLKIRELALLYQDKSILNPENGARFIDAPSGLDCDPGKLVNGVRGERGAGWYHPGPITEPLTFSWSLAKPTMITTIVLHQDCALPVRHCRIRLSNSRNSAVTEKTLEFLLPDGMEDDLVLPPFVNRLDGRFKFDTMSLEILEGVFSDGAGLDGIEVFAENFTPPPNPAPVNVSHDISDLEPGSTVYYRIACRATDADDGETTVVGETRFFTLPKQDNPRLHQVDQYSLSDSKFVFQVCGNAMGQRTTLHWRLNDSDWQIVSMGWEMTTVHRYITLRNLNAGTHQLHVWLQNNAGESEVVSVSFVVG